MPFFFSSDAKKKVSLHLNNVDLWQKILLAEDEVNIASFIERGLKKSSDIR